MKLIKGDNKPSFSDKLPNGDRPYSCPCCLAHGFTIPCLEVTSSHSMPMIRDGQLILGRSKQREIECPQCKQTVAIRIRGKWQMIGAV